MRIVISLDTVRKEIKMNRKEFISQVGAGTALLLIPACIGGLAGCTKDNLAPTSVDFTLDVSSGPLASNGGSLVQSGVIVARTNSGSYIAVSAACTHQGTQVNYAAGNNNFVCPNHGAKFDSSGSVTHGPANKNLTKYNTTLTGSSLRVFS